MTDDTSPRLLPRRRLLGLAAAGFSLAAMPRGAWAETYPSRPVTMVIPYPAGGPTDSVGRMVAEKMRTTLGQSIVLDNVSGAAGSIGLGRVARSPADGYTIEVGNWSAHVVNGAIYTLPYDLRTSFEPIALLARAPQLVLSSKAVPATDLKSLIAWIKGRDGKVTIGTAGVGSPPHIAAVFFLKMIGAQAQLVPYRGAAPAVQDLVAGQIDLVFTDPTSAVPQVRAGALKAYAVSAPERLPGAPEIPTADEAGLPGFHVATWNAMFAPKGTPKSIIGTLNAAAVAALADPSLVARFTELGQTIPPRDQQSPEALDALVQADIEKWWPIIKAAGIKAD